MTSAPRALPFAAVLLASLACNQPHPPPPAAEPKAEAAATPEASAPATADTSASDLPSDASAAVAVVDPGPPAPTDPMATHYESAEDILKLVTFPDATPEVTKRRDAYLAYNFGPGPGHFNQGLKAIAHHDISKAKCLEGLKGVVLQTDEQKAQCGGAEYMIPIYKDGKKETAKYCIDAFEFPNKPCELPLVWTAPSATQTICSMQGKRLCTQQEWSTACRADPEGGADSIYAYGNDLDLAVCNTNKPHESTNGQWNCRAQTAQIAWQTCSTDTEPSGAFPKCKSRFGVFDQHGNVAEVMTRTDADAGLVSQLKGSAFFYVDVARKHNEAQPKDAPRETYPDHCNYDPRWHVESMKSALHVNYHLGFRCCKSI